MRSPALCRALSPVVLMLVAALACSAPAPAPPPGPGGVGGPGTPGPVGRPLDIKVGWSAVGAQAAPLWVALDAGLFPKHGLTVEPLFVEDAAAAVQAAVSGEAPIVVTSSQAAVNARLEGADAVDIAQYVPSPPYVLVAAPRIQDGNDLRGGRVGTAPRDAAAEVALQHAVRKLGLDPSREVTVVPIGAPDARLAALQTGSIDAALVDEAVGAEATRQGFPVLADGRDLQFPFASVVTTGRFATEQPETVRAFMRAFVEAIQHFKTKPEAAKPVLRQWLKAEHESQIDDTWDAYAHRYLASKPYPTLQGAQAMLEFAAQTSPRVIVASPLDYINPRFVEELDRSGFIDRLGR